MADEKAKRKGVDPVGPRPVIEMVAQPLYSTEYFLPTKEEWGCISFFVRGLVDFDPILDGRRLSFQDTNLFKGMCLPIPTSYHCWGIVAYPARQGWADAIHWLRENSYVRLYIGSKCYLSLPTACILHGPETPSGGPPYVMDLPDDVRDILEQEKLKREEVPKVKGLQFIGDYCPLVIYTQKPQRKDQLDYAIPQTNAGRSQPEPEPDRADIYSWVDRTGRVGAWSLYIPSECMFYATMEWERIRVPDGLINPNDPPIIRMFLIGIMRREIQ